MKVLIVEDNPALGKVLQRGVEEAGWIVDMAVDGEEGLYFLENGHYDVIAADWMLPKISGMDLLKKMRDRGDMTPFLIISARGAVDDRIACIEMGADDYIVKPFALPEFTVRLKALFRRSHGTARPYFQLGSLRLNLSSQQAFLRDQELGLTAMEFNFLKVLLAKSNKVVRRLDLVKSLYNLNDEPESNSMDVILNRLRKKLQGSDVEIATFRGKGIVLRECQPH